MWHSQLSLYSPFNLCGLKLLGSPETPFVTKIFKTATASSKSRLLRLTFFKSFLNLVVKSKKYIDLQIV